jgi:hypothetical protein
MVRAITFTRLFVRFGHRESGRGRLGTNRSKTIGNEPVENCGRDLNPWSGLESVSTSWLLLSYGLAAKFDGQVLWLGLAARFCGQVLLPVAVVEIAAMSESFVRRP